MGSVLYVISLGVPLIGCASHRCNISAQLILREEEELLDKVNALMYKLKTFTLSSMLSKQCNLCVVTRNHTGWSSTFQMLRCYERFQSFLR